MTSQTTPEFPRTFVPTDADISQWDQLEPLFRDLSTRDLKTTEAIETWMLHVSELAACLSEERARRYIAMTCNTSDPDNEARYMQFIEEIDPKCKPYWHAMNELYLKSPARSQLSMERYGIIDRNTEAELKLYREENIPLQTEAQKKSQHYQKLCGAMTVTFDGEEKTLPQMGTYLEEPDRQRREEAFLTVAKRRLQDRDKMEQIFTDLVSLRNTIARNAGHDDYVGYTFMAFKRFDYTPDDCFAFHDAVETCVVPVIRAANEERRTTMKLETLRPWDTSVDPLGRDPLKPFSTGDELNKGVHTIIQKLDPELAAMYEGLYSRGELDLESRKGKAPGGYQYSLEEVRRPFIFMNAAGLHRDVVTLLHEAGHAFHSLLCREEPLIEYRSSPIEFAEVASMSMELFGAAHYEEFYSEADAARARRKHLEGTIQILPWIAQIDAFQHWIYTHPNHTVAERTEQWMALSDRFGGGIDWTGHEEIRESLWQRQLHLYCHAFYYIEYGIAQLGALQLWRCFKEDRIEALKRYKNALRLGGTKPLPELFAAASIPFDFSRTAIEPLMEVVDSDLNQLPL